MNSIHYLAATVDRAFHHNENDNASSEDLQDIRETHDLLKKIEEEDMAQGDVEGDESDNTEFKNFNLLAEVEQRPNYNTKENNELDQPQEVTVANNSTLDDSDIVTRVDEVSISKEDLEDDDQFYQNNDDNEETKIYQEAQLHRASIIRTIFNIIFFLPNQLIVRPIGFILFIITYPVRFVYYTLFGTSIEQLNAGDESMVDDPIENDSDTGDITSMSTTTSFQLSPSVNSPSDSMVARQQRSSYTSNRTISTIAEDEIEFDPASYGVEDDQVKSPTTNIPAEEAEVELSKGRLTPNQSRSPSPSLITTPVSKALSRLPSRQSDQATSSAQHPRRKFLFPKLLFNFQINSPPVLPTKTLVLDLDETLIHSLSRHNTSVIGKNQGTTIEVKQANKVPTLYYVYKRPFVDEFLSIVRQWFNLVCFTASIQEYADPVINFLETEVQLKAKEKNKFTNDHRTFSSRLYRNSCVFIEGKGYIKDLSALVSRPRPSMNRSNSGRPASSGADATPASARTDVQSPSRDSSRTRTPDARNERREREREEQELGKVIIIDNSPISYSMQSDNGIMIEGWINDPDDMELMNLLPLLNSLRFTSDVRTVLGLRGGQISFE